MNSSEINGYLIVKGAFNSGEGSFGMENHSQINDSVLAACGLLSSDSAFGNNCQINGNFWTLKNITMDNSSWIEGTVYMPKSPIIMTPAPPNARCKDLDTDELNDGIHRFMLDIGDTYSDGGVSKTVLPGESVFPQLPQAESVGFTGTEDVKISKDNRVIDSDISPFGKYDEIEISNSARLTIKSGTYHINSFIMKNSSRVTFDFDNGPILIYVATSVSLSNSASFEYLDHGIASDKINFGADLLYLEPRLGMTCSNSVQWKGFIYAPEGDVTFSNGTNLFGAVYSKEKVNISNHITATYVPPAFDYDIDGGKHAILLPDKFYPQGIGGN